MSAPVAFTHITLDDCHVFTIGMYQYKTLNIPIVHTNSKLNKKEVFLIITVVLILGGFLTYTAYELGKASHNLEMTKSYLECAEVRRADAFRNNYYFKDMLDYFMESPEGHEFREKIYENKTDSFNGI
jgi:uncharacterized protein YxeA